MGRLVNCCGGKNAVFVGGEEEAATGAAAVAVELRADN